MQRKTGRDQRDDGQRNAAVFAADDDADNEREKEEEDDDEECARGQLVDQWRCPSIHRTLPVVRIRDMTFHSPHPFPSCYLGKAQTNKSRV